MKVGLKDLQNLTRRLYLKLEYPGAQTETISEAREGFIGTVFCGSSKMVAPSGSSERAFGSNPVAIGIPTGGDTRFRTWRPPRCLFSRLRRLCSKARACPQTWAMTLQASQPKLPRKFLVSGALMTFDRGRKSSGLALMVELFANALTGGCLPGDPDHQNWGNLAFAIDPDLLVGRESFLKNVDRTMAHIKGLKRTDPARDIRLPGELSFIRSERAIATQELEIDEDLSGPIGSGSFRRFCKS